MYARISELFSAHRWWYMQGMLFTIGHSTHPIAEFIRILKVYGIEMLVDIRTIPGSRHNPQFAKENLAESLEAEAIRYRYMKDLGGLRHPKRDSRNLGWRNASFRGYADYMQTEAFQRALRELITLADRYRTVIMCAEAVPWRCHRSLVGDALLVRGVEVTDIMSEHKSSPHRLTSFAEVHGDEVCYPGEDLFTRA